MDVQATEVQTDRILTIPNVLSFLRLLGVPLFLWLVLVPEADGWAFVLLVVSGATDWLDGAIARATGQISRLGQLLDPLADRLYIAATLVGLAIRGIIPWWLVVVLLSRDLVLAVVLALLKRRGITGLPVHFLGKAATFCLLWGFPMLLLGAGATGTTFTLAEVARDVGWAFAIWGTALYWWAGILYLEQARRILRTPAP
ncbi:MAG: CDP-alcohol phosphatidyltransferase family protein [Actinomycetales bacterium]|nr:CDP-alcohol phosphatidyltransferase family protein [Actinomycetales bacterium]